MTEEKEEIVKRKVVVPGEVIIKGEDYLPGDWTTKEGDSIIANKFGLAEESGRLVKVIPLSGGYIPRRGNIVIGQVKDITFNGWIVDIDAHYQAFLSLNEFPRFISKNDLAEHYTIGDLLIAQVLGIKRTAVDLTLKSRGLGKIEKGLIIRVNSNKVPRVIGKGGSMVNLIKTETNCEISIGQNGIIWIKGENVEDELKAKKVILFVTEKSASEGLTEKVEKFLKENKTSGDKN